MRAFIIIQRLTLDESAGCDAFLVKSALEKAGFECGIYSYQMSAEAASMGAKRIEMLSDTTDDDLIVYIHKEGYQLFKRISKLCGKKILIYHEPVRPDKKSFPIYGEQRRQYISTVELKDCIDGAMVFSRDGALDLKVMGFECPVVKREIMLSEKLLMKTEGSSVPDYYSEKGLTDIVCCCRLVPDEKIEKVIAAYAAYRRYYNRKSRLVLAVSGDINEEYKRKLIRYTDMMALEGVGFAKADSVRERRGYIAMADALILQGSTDDFPDCAAEAVFMGKPVAAEKSSPNAEALGEDMLISGLEPHIAAVFIDKAVSDSMFRETAVNYSRQHLEKDRADGFVGCFKELLGKMVNTSEKNSNS